MKFRKKPVIIEAVQWTGDMGALKAAGFPELPTHGPPGQSGSLRISTLEGDMELRVGDWLIRGVKGELYPCKPDIFAATYEPV